MTWIVIGGLVLIIAGFVWLEYQDVKEEQYIQSLLDKVTKRY